MPQRRSPNSRPPRSRIKMTFGSKNLTSNVEGQRKSQVKCPSRCFRRYVKPLKTRNPESHTKMSSDNRGLIKQDDYTDAAKRWAHQKQPGSGGNPYWSKL